MNSMAAGATMYVFEIELADTDRGVYEQFTLRAARHPSETDAYLVTRVLAYCLEFEDGITFSDGISTTADPAVLVRDLSGKLLAWIEVGAPDAARLHTGSKAAERTTIYTHRDPTRVLAQWTGAKIHRAEEIVLHSFEPGFIDSAVGAIERRNALTLTVTERQLYLELNGLHLSSAVHDHPIS
ncbi:Uncharacterized conserved protein YaeQ, suppresses RfaH defect [Nocardioides alpinus]|uniref:Uncharacterized conserved protein YaeQ, suppresses RfaH defect n=2 Tax=Nocardioides alpinus TaxID=748909 RepID=A0A1I0ZTQ3_9ACTN|nr:Uncharacterized conserved protein YaeQ, suppresses RfaH defect [Nocardioides alpinus]